MNGRAKVDNDACMGGSAAPISRCSMLKAPNSGTAGHTDILIVLASLRAEGTPRMALDLCRLWQARGVSVVVLELGRGPDEMGSAFRRISIPVFHSGFAEGGWLRYLRLARTVHRTCRELRPAAVLSMPSGIHAFIGLGAKLAGAGRVVVHQGVYPWHWKAAQFRKYRLEYRMGRPFTDCVVACSRYVQAGVEKYLDGGGRNLATIYNGIDVERFMTSVRSANRATRQVPRVVMVGRIDETKDFGTLVEATGVLSRRGLQVHCSLVGEGAQRAVLERKVQQAGLADRIRFLGSRADIPEILADSDVFAYSVKPEEGLGIALIEAMAAGVPVVASDVPACREVLEDGALGVLVAPEDPADLADGIRAVLEHPGEARTRADLARAKVAAEFTSERMAEQYLDVLGLGQRAIRADVPAVSACAPEPCR